jgi:hypothetical protein
MKNKGRRHKAGRNERMTGILDCKGYLTHLTRPVTSMSPKGRARTKMEKKKWIKRIRGYFKSQTKEVNNE